MSYLCNKCEYPFKTLWSLIFSVHVIIFNNDFECVGKQNKNLVEREDEEKTLEKKNDLLKHNIKLKLCEIEEAKRETEQLKLR